MQIKCHLRVIDTNCRFSELAIGERFFRATDPSSDQIGSPFNGKIYQKISPVLASDFFEISQVVEISQDESIIWVCLVDRESQILQELINDPRISLSLNDDQEINAWAMAFMLVQSVLRSGDRNHWGFNATYQILACGTQLVDTQALLLGCQSGDQEATRTLFEVVGTTLENNGALVSLVKVGAEHAVAETIG